VARVTFLAVVERLREDDDTDDADSGGATAQA
jgi:hypothetical protein